MLVVSRFTENVSEAYNSTNASRYVLFKDAVLRARELRRLEVYRLQYSELKDSDCHSLVETYTGLREMILPVNLRIHLVYRGINLQGSFKIFDRTSIYWC